MKFDWDKFKDINNRIAMHCKTIEESNDFCRRMHEHGMVWMDGSSYLKINNFNEYKGKTCYFGAEGTYGNYKYFIEHNYTILEWSDYMENEFTKADLKDGMFVVFRNGLIGIKIGNFLIGLDVWNDFNRYTKDLNLNGYEDEFDIVKIGTLKHGKWLKYIGEKDLDIIWERGTRKLTTEDAVKKLRELTGEDYEIV